MKIILAPSKSQTLGCSLKGAGRPLLFEEKSLQLVDMLKMMDKEELGRLFKIKGKLLDDTYDLYHGYIGSDCNSFGINNVRYDPVKYYDGVVYEALGKRDFSLEERKYMEEHLVIMSAMFGVLEPGMGIWPYRLDFKTRPGGLNLYKYWQNEVLGYFSGVDVVVNLASEEFSSILKPMAGRLLNIHFLESDGRCLSYHVKKARGVMAAEIVGLRLENVGDLRDLVVDGYMYDEKKSDESNYFYIRGGC